MVEDSFLFSSVHEALTHYRRRTFPKPKAVTLDFESTAGDRTIKVPASGISDIANNRYVWAILCLQKIYSTHNESDRELFTLRYIGGETNAACEISRRYSVTEIAELKGMSKQTVSRRTNKLLDDLHDELVRRGLLYQEPRRH